MSDELNIPMPRMAPAGATTWRNAGRRESGDTGMRRLVLAAGVIGGGLLLAVGGWSFMGHRPTGVPVVQADVRPLRSKPENAGGLQVSGQDDAILSGASEGTDGMAPPPETPDPQSLRTAAAAPPVPAAPSLPAASPAQPVSLAAPMPARMPLPVTAAPEQSATAKAPLPPLVPHAVVAGPYVQLAALVTEDAAKLEWQRLLHRAPDLLGGRQPMISRLERTDGKIFWRLRTSGFPDIAQATAFCEKVRAKGLSCSLTGS